MSESLDAPYRSGPAIRRTGFAERQPEAITLAATVFCAYYLGALVGLALTFQPQPIAVLWPPNAILFAALLATPPRSWWIVLGAAFPAHLASELGAGVPTSMVLCWYLSNVTEALIGAIAYRTLAGQPARFERVGEVAHFLLAAAISVILSSFLDSAFVRLNGFGTREFWDLWGSRVVANITADVVLIPAIVALLGLPASWRRPSPRRVAEGVALAAGTLAITLVVFQGSVAQGAYLPLIFLLWASLRFSPGAMSLGFAVVTLGAIWGAGHNTGVLGGRAPLENAHAVQVFALSMGPMLLFLSAAFAERRKNEESMRASDRRFRMVLEATTDTVYERNVKSGELWWSRNCRSYLGYARTSELPATPAGLARAIHPDDREHVAALQDSALADASNAWEAEFRLRRADGSYVHVQEQAFIIRDSLGAPMHVIGMLTDITEKRETEELHQRLAHASRLTVMGELAASIAHEINQPITAILMNAEAARVLLDSGRGASAEFSDIIDEIASDDMRASEIVRHFRNLATRHATEVERFDLNDVVRSVMRIAQPTARRRGVTLRAESSDIPFARADRIHMQQVLLNLIFNGMDALGDGGAVRDRVLVVKTAPAGNDLIRVSVRDSGHGIASRDAERIFESFYTTKPDGLGLGLAIARSLVTAWGGRIWAENNDGAGATFTFIVPADVPAAKLTQAPP
jgi:PAS domain S-box-containing protein